MIDALHTGYSWTSADATSVVRHAGGEVRWWTFGGGVANALLADHLQPAANARADNLSLRFPTGIKLTQVEELIGGLSADRIEPVLAEDAMEGMKFSECLPPQVAAEVFCVRFNDPDAVRTILAEPRRVVVEQSKASEP